MSKPRLGKNQLARLCALGRPSAWQVVGCPETRSLARIGYLATHEGDPDGFYGITPAGLRRLADALEAGNLGHLMPTRENMARREA